MNSILDSLRQKNLKNIIVKHTQGKGRGVFALKNFTEGEIVIFGIVDKVMTKQDIYSVQVGLEKHVFMEQIVFMNHSCNPNLRVQENQYGGYNFISRKNISIDDELTFDYASTEWVTVTSSKCMCKEATCRGYLGGYSTLSECDKEKAYQYAAKYIQEQSSI